MSTINNDEMQAMIRALLAENNSIQKTESTANFDALKASFSEIISRLDNHIESNKKEFEKLEGLISGNESNIRKETEAREKLKSEVTSIDQHIENVKTDLSEKLTELNDKFEQYHSDNIKKLNGLETAQKEFVTTEFGEHTSKLQNFIDRTEARIVTLEEHKSPTDDIVLKTAKDLLVGTPSPISVHVEEDDVKDSFVAHNSFEHVVSGNNKSRKRPLNKDSEELDEYQSDNEFYYKDIKDCEDPVEIKRAYERRRSIFPVRGGSGYNGGGGDDDDPDDVPNNRERNNGGSGRQSNGGLGRNVLNANVLTVELVKRADFPNLVLDNHKSISALVKFYTEWEQIRLTHPNHTMSIMLFATPEVRVAIRSLARKLGFLTLAAGPGTENRLSEKQVKKCLYEQVKAQNRTEFILRLKRVKMDTSGRFKVVKPENLKAFVDELPIYNDRFNMFLKFLTIRADPSVIPYLYYKERAPGMVDYWLDGIGPAAKRLYQSVKARYPQIEHFNTLMEVTTFFMEKLQTDVENTIKHKELSLILEGAAEPDRSRQDSDREPDTTPKRKPFYPVRKKQNQNAITGHDPDELDAHSQLIPPGSGFDYEDAYGEEDSVFSGENKYAVGSDEEDNQSEGGRSQDLNAFAQKQSSAPRGQDGKDVRKGGCYKHFLHGDCPDYKLGKCEYDHSTDAMMEVLTRKISELVMSVHTPDEEYIHKLVKKAVAAKNAKKAGATSGRKGT